MKKVLLISLLSALTAGAASAAEPGAKPTAGAMGLTVSTAFDNTTPYRDDLILNGKYLISNDSAVLAGFGLRIAGGDAKGTDLGFMIGFRKYMRSDALSPFVGGRFQYQNAQDSTLTGMAFIAEGGAEYFLSKQFSVEGRVGFGYISSDSKATAGAAASKVTLIGTTGFTLNANFYF
jgi:hypothetical protein